MLKACKQPASLPAGMNIAHRYHDMIRHGLAFILFFKTNKAKAAKE